MPLYTCPSCHSFSLTWDSRSKAFLCTNRTCNEAIRPSDDGKTSAESLALAISTGRAVVIQQWLDRQPRSSHSAV
jgi:hypothetical protein